MNQIMNSALFHPSMPEHERHNFMRSDLCSAALNVIAKTKKAFPIYKVLVQAHHRKTVDDVGCPHESVTLGLDTGACVLTIDKEEFGSYSISTFDRPGDTHWKETVGKSRRLPYLIRRLFKTAGEPYEMALFLASRHSAERISAALDEIVQLIAREKRDSVRLKETLTVGAIRELLDYYASRGSMSALDMRHASEIQDVLDARELYKESVSVVEEKIRAKFSGRKWFVGTTMPYESDKHRAPGFFVGAFKAADFVEDMIKVSKYSVASMQIDHINMDIPLTLYRSLDDLPDSFRDDLLSSLMMSKVYIEGRRKPLTHIDPTGQVPLSDDTVSYDAINVYSGQHVKFNWVILDR